MRFAHLRPWRFACCSRLPVRIGIRPRRREPSRGRRAKPLLLSESGTLAGPPPLLQGLSQGEREMVLSHGRRRVLNRGQTLFSQGTTPEGIYLVESGRIRVFYNAPSGREITLAYWNPGNFVGGPDIFGSSPHSWSGRRRHQQQRAATARQGVARSGDENSGPRDRPDRRPRIQGQMLFGHGADARHALRHGAARASAAASGRRLRHQGIRRHPDRRCLHACRSGTHGRCHPAMGHDEPEALSGAGHRRVPEIADHCVSPGRTSGDCAAGNKKPAA